MLSRMAIGADPDAPERAEWWLLPVGALLRVARAKRADRARWSLTHERLTAPLDAAEPPDRPHASPPPEAEKSAPRALCPSAMPEAGALLFARVNPLDEVEWAREARPIDAATARALDVPLGRAAFRLAAPCAGQGCGHWRAHRCGLIDVYVAHAPREGGSGTGSCAIRDACRWRRQRGDPACAVCAGVTYGMFDRW